MAYIGVQPTDTYLSIASQQITGTGSATYTLNYSVSNEEDVAVFVNNVRQNVSSYTVSGDQLTLGGTISASDECWVLFLGRTVGTKTPAVGSVTNDMLSGSIATSKLADGSTFATTNGITEADQWRLTTAFSGDAVPISSNLERNDSLAFSKIGTGMSQSSGVWTFPSTGIWYVKGDFTFDEEATGGADSATLGRIYTSTDGGSSFTVVSSCWGQLQQSNDHLTIGCDTFVDVTSTTDVKVRFTAESMLSNNRVLGSTDQNYTWFTFIRMGDT